MKSPRGLLEFWMMWMAVILKMILNITRTFLGLEPRLFWILQVMLLSNHPNLAGSYDTRTTYCIRLHICDIYAIYVYIFSTCKL